MSINPALSHIDSTLEDESSERKKAKILKRKAASDRLDELREELFTGDFNGLVTTARLKRHLTPSLLFRLLVASQYEPWSILDELFPYLGGSASIVIQSPFHQVRSALCT